MKNEDLVIKMNEVLVAISKMGVSPAIPTVIPAVIPISPSSDHDLLQRLDGKVDGLKADIRSLADGTSTQLTDHEVRLKAVEKAITRIMAGGTVVIFILGVVEFIITKFWN